MKNLIRALPIAIGALFLAASAQATTIDFGTPSDPIYNTTDPTVGDVKFWAGDPLALPAPHDTFVDDAMTPGNNYLMSGVADGYGMSPASGYDAFIGVNRLSSALFGTVQVDIAADFQIPSGTALTLEAFLGGSLVGSTAFSAADTSYHTLSLTLLNGADKLFLSDALNQFNQSNTSFHIDNFVYSDFQAPCQGPGCNPTPAPEPGMLWLLGAGLMGVAASRRRGVF